MANYGSLVQKTRNAFASGKTKDVKWRKQQLFAMLRMIDERRGEMVTALHKDLNKHRNESVLTEVDYVRNELIDAINQLDTWVKPEKVTKNLMTIGDSAYINYEPYGVALIIGAWNYPVQLVLSPMIGAIAAGNCMIVKPSEVSDHTAKLMESLINEYMDNECISVVNGGVPETTALLRERYDYIFYTGNPQVAKIIAEAAAKHLTPTTLELGGKSPAYVSHDSDLDIAARRIIWGKWTNAGQTCIAPDYVMCTKEVEGRLVEKIRHHLIAFFGDNPQKSDSYGRIVNNRHFHRVKGLMSSGKMVIGGEMDEDDNYIAPTVVVDVRPTDSVMEQEVFGPVLPIYCVQNDDEAIAYINSREKPLAMYVFSQDKNLTKKFISCTSSGGFCGNDCLMQNSLMTLPFGGVGNSGSGQYHGRFSFVMFSHRKACLLKAQNMEKLNDLRYPPYTEKKRKIAQWVLTKKVKSSSRLMSFAPIVLLGLVIGFVVKMLGMQRYMPNALKN